MGWPRRRDIGWAEIGEEFTRWTLLWTPWFAVYLHRVWAPKVAPKCHNHPWSFVTFILWGGYWEWNRSTDWVWRKPGSVLRRHATWSHNVVTLERPSWSLVIVGPKLYGWSQHECR